MPKESTGYFIDRRSQPDRRTARLRVSGLFRFRRRQQLRRREDLRKLVLLDRYPWPLLVTAALVLLLSMGDAFLTLLLTAEGARELNPVMNYLLLIGPYHFVAVKYWLTAAAVTIVLLFYYYPLRGLNIPTHAFLSVFMLLFSAVIIWQLYLIKRFVM